MSMVVDKVKAAFVSAFGVEPDKFSVEMMPEDVQGWDSLGHLTLVTALQEQFGVEFEVNEVMDMDSVQKIVAICESKSAA
ncbi:MAG: acyl carrier protein [Labilithrix sp.]|nr:acyl carrier protein [Labilithrix sp.]